MEAQTFAHTFAGEKKFYFKVKSNKTGELFYFIEPYQQKFKGFNITRESSNEKWQIAAEANVPTWVKELETDFGKVIDEKLSAAE